MENLYSEIGEMEGCRRLSALFHSRVAADPVLAAIFPPDISAVAEAMALFIAEQLGGPAEYSARWGKKTLQGRHSHLPIGCSEGEAWLGHMLAAIGESGYSASVCERLRTYFVRSAISLEDPTVEINGVPEGALQAALDSRSASASVAPTPAEELLDAAAAWEPARVRAALDAGAPVDSRDRLGHDALYHAADGQAVGRDPEGLAVVLLLLERGSNPSGHSGSGRLTPLHVAARRGNLAIAEALLDGGAVVDARDARGETPLRRAVNGGIIPMVDLLLERGADPRSADRRGVTLLTAARHDRVRDRLRAAGA